MKNKMGYAFISAVLCLMVWSCTETASTPNTANNQAQVKPVSVNSFLPMAKVAQQIGPSIVKAVAKSAAISDNEDSVACYDNYSTCIDNAETDADFEACENTEAECLISATTPTEVSHVPIPAACQALLDGDGESYQTLEAALNAEVACFQALNICPQFIQNFQSVIPTVVNCENAANTCYNNDENDGDYENDSNCDIQDSLCEVSSSQVIGIPRCLSNVNQDTAGNILQFAQIIEAASSCFCGGSGNIFGNDSSMIYRAFAAKAQSAAAGAGFSTSSQMSTVGTTFTSSSQSSLGGQSYADTSHSAAGGGFQAQQP